MVEVPSLKRVDALGRPRSIYDMASIALFAIVAVLILFTFKDYGVTWDEPVQSLYGKLIGRYYFYLLQGNLQEAVASLPADAWYSGLNLYGGLFDSIAAIATRVSPLGVYETRHLLNASVGWLGIIGCWKAARFVGGPGSGFWAALFLTLTPRYYGPMFNNPKDIPFAVGFIWSMYYILRFMAALPNPSRKLMLKLGCVIGLTLAVRIAGLLLWGYLGLILVAYFAFKIRPDGVPLQSTWKLVKSLVSAAALAWIIMLLFWPWAQLHITHPFAALGRFTNNYPWMGSVLLDGKFISASNLPPTYLPRWFAIGLPEIVLVALALGLVVSIAQLGKSGSLKSFRVQASALLVFSVVFPLLYVVVKRPVLYNAERHFLFLTPLFVCLAALSWQAAIEWLSQRSRPLTLMTLGGCAIYVIFQAGIMVRLHPAEYVYFNQTVGGLMGAWKAYDTDYWGNSYREAVQALVHRLEQNNEADQPYKVMTLSLLDSSTYYFPRSFSYTRDPKEADFFIGTTHQIRYDQEFHDERLTEIDADPVILTVEHLGVPLAIVKDLRPAKAARALTSRDVPQKITP